MSARIRRPAEEVERELEAAEKVERRRADKEPRKRVSDQEAARDALFRVWGCTPQEIETLSILINLSKGCAPGESVKISETEAGRLLGNTEGITDNSCAKKWQRRFVEDVEQGVMLRTRKLIALRTPGKFIHRGKDEHPIKRCAEYSTEITQAICDVIRLARLSRGKRYKCFTDAALAVHAELPDYKPALKVVESSEGLKKEAPKKERAGGSSRAMTRLERDVTQLVDLEKEKGAPALLTQYSRIRAKVADIALPAMAADPEVAIEALRIEFIEAAKLQLELARKQGPEAVEALQARLFADLGALFADPAAPEEAETDAEEGAVKQKLLHSNFSENLQNPEQNRNSDSKIVDKNSPFLHASQGAAPGVFNGKGPPPDYVREVFE